MVGRAGQSTASALRRSSSEWIWRRTSEAQEQDADGSGRSLAFLCEPPAGQREVDSTRAGWYAVISSAPLSELAGDSSTFSWAIAIDEGGSNMSLGVALPSSSVVPGFFATDDKAYGLWTRDLSFGQWAHANRLVAPKPGMTRPPRPSEPAALIPQKGQRRVLRLTADLTQNTLSYAGQIVTVPSAGDAGASVIVATAEHESSIDVPGLAAYHLHAGSAYPVKLTLLD